MAFRGTNGNKICLISVRILMGSFENCLPCNGSLDPKSLTTPGLERRFKDNVLNICFWLAHLHSADSVASF